MLSPPQREAKSRRRVYEKAEAPAEERKQKPRRQQERRGEVDEEEEPDDGDVEEGVDNEGAEQRPAERGDPARCRRPAHCRHVTSPILHRSAGFEGLSAGLSIRSNNAAKQLGRARFH